MRTTRLSKVFSGIMKNIGCLGEFKLSDKMNKTREIPPPQKQKLLSANLERRGGIQPMTVPVLPNGKSRTPNARINLNVLETLRSNNHSTSPHRFARALGIPDIAARHLLNHTRFLISKIKPRKELRGHKSMLRGPSIYDLPDQETRREPSPDLQETLPKKKNSLYDLILKTTSSRQNLYKALEKEIKKEVHFNTSDED